MLLLNADTSDLEYQLSQLEHYIDDWVPFWDHIIDNVIVDWIDTIFDTAGFGRWEPRKDDLPHPLLQDTLNLRNALTDPNDPDNYTVKSRDGLEYGSTVEYQEYHEYGTVNLPARPIVEMLDDIAFFDRQLEQEIDNYFQYIIDRRF